METLELLKVIILSCQINAAGHGYSGDPKLVASEIMDLQISKQKECVKNKINCFKQDNGYHPLTITKTAECFGK